MISFLLLETSLNHYNYDENTTVTALVDVTVEDRKFILLTIILMIVLISVILVLDKIKNL